jgi:hypothetical protein
VSPIARKALVKLLGQAESAWGRESTDRQISLRFSEASFPDYLQLGSYAHREECNADLRLAEQSGAIAIDWDVRAGELRQIERIRLVNPDKLADLVKVDPLWVKLHVAECKLASKVAIFPVLLQVLAAWKRGVQVRGTRPSDWPTWLDAVRVVEHCRMMNGDDLPIRRLSTTLFADSKRIEALWSAMDVLLQGDVSAPVRSDEEVFGELGLVKFPPTLLLAGDGFVHLGDQVLPLTRPYLGLPPRTISRFSSFSGAKVLLSVENLTTFHELCELCRPEDGHILIYSAGMPSPSWLRVYELLLAELPDDAQVRHWGDIDTGGFRIADYIAKAALRKKRQLLLHGMNGSLSVEESGGRVVRRSLSDGEVSAIVRICDFRGWISEADWVNRSRFAIEQESMRIAL